MACNSLIKSAVQWHLCSLTWCNCESTWFLETPCTKVKKNTGEERQEKNWALGHFWLAPHKTQSIHRGSQLAGFPSLPGSNHIFIVTQIGLMKPMSHCYWSIPKGNRKHAYPYPVLQHHTLLCKSFELPLISLYFFPPRCQTFLGKEGSAAPALFPCPEPEAAAVLLPLLSGQRALFLVFGTQGLLRTGRLHRG